MTTKRISEGSSLLVVLGLAGLAIVANAAVLTFSILLLWNWMPVNANRQISLQDAMGAAALLSIAGSCFRSGSKS